MYRVIEKEDSYGIFFVVQTIDSENAVASTRKVQYRQYMTDLNGRLVFMIYSTDMAPVTEVNEFINFDAMNRLSRNYTYLAANALRLLCDYLDIFGVDLSKMTKKDALGYIDFLRGVSRRGVMYETHLETCRRAETVNEYLNMARKFVSFLGYDDHVLLKKGNAFRKTIVNDRETTVAVQKYDVNVKTAPEKAEVPAYISVDEYRRILEACKDTPDPLGNRLVCRLIFEHGLRLGEALGLTIEDIKGFDGQDGFPHYCVELRNRVSDEMEQACKSATKVWTADDYRRPEYRHKGIGYFPIVLSDNLADELLEYVNTVHDDSRRLSKKEKGFFARREQYAKADSVPGGNPDIQRNYYIFLNRNGRPLTANMFNKRLRAIYNACSIPVDYGTRKNNCSHRLRHGFAMLMKSQGVSDFDLMTLMRHKQLSTTAIYSKPTAEDVAAMRENLLPKVFEAIFEESD